MSNDVVKDESYFESAIQYNDELATFAGDLAERVEHPEIQRWCRGVAKQHKYHAKLMRRSYQRLKEENVNDENGDTTDETDVARWQAEEDKLQAEPDAGSLTQEEIARLEAQTEAAQNETYPVAAPPPVESAPDVSEAAVPVDAGVEPDESAAPVEADVDSGDESA